DAALRLGLNTDLVRRQAKSSGLKFLDGRGGKAMRRRPAPWQRPALPGLPRAVPPAAVRNAAPLSDAPVAEADLRLLQAIGAVLLSKHTRCQFIAADPRQDAAICGRDCVPGLSWCAGHALRVYDMARLRA